MVKKVSMPVFVKQGEQYMDVIKAIKDFVYYQKITGQSKEHWKKWRTKEMKKYGLSENRQEGEKENGANCTNGNIKRSIQQDRDKL